MKQGPSQNREPRPAMCWNVACAGEGGWHPEIVSSSAPPCTSTTSSCDSGAVMDAEVHVAANASC